MSFTIRHKVFQTAIFYSLKSLKQWNTVFINWVLSMNMNYDRLALWFHLIDNFFVRFRFRFFRPLLSNCYHFTLMIMNVTVDSKTLMDPIFLLTTLHLGSLTEKLQILTTLSSLLSLPTLKPAFYTGTSPQSVFHCGEKKIIIFKWNFLNQIAFCCFWIFFLLKHCSPQQKKWMKNNICFQ